MRRIIIAGIAVIAAGGWYWTTRPAFFDTGMPLRATGDAINLLDDLGADEPGAGWRHRTFFRITPADYRIVHQGGERVLQCVTDNSASILARDMDVPLAALHTLSWRWRVDQPIDSDLDEALEEGDDHPLRFYLQFANEAGETRSAEIIWSNRKYAPGDYKVIGSFYHYVANGLDANIGQWHDQTLDLRQLYRDIGGVGVPRLETLGFFCDSDNTGARSDGMFADVVLSN